MIAIPSIRLTLWHKRVRVAFCYLEASGMSQQYYNSNLILYLCCQNIKISQISVIRWCCFCQNIRIVLFFLMLILKLENKPNNCWTVWRIICSFLFSTKISGRPLDSQDPARRPHHSPAKTFCPTSYFAEPSRPPPPGTPSPTSLSRQTFLTVPPCEPYSGVVSTIRVILTSNSKKLLCLVWTGICWLLLPSSRQKLFLFYSTQYQLTIIMLQCITTYI